MQVIRINIWVVDFFSFWSCVMSQMKDGSETSAVDKIGLV